MWYGVSACIVTSYRSCVHQPTLLRSAPLASCMLLHAPLLIDGWTSAVGRGLAGDNPAQATRPSTSAGGVGGCRGAINSSFPSDRKQQQSEPLTGRCMFWEVAVADTIDCTSESSYTKMCRMVFASCMCSRGEQENNFVRGLCFSRPKGRRGVAHLCTSIASFIVCEPMA